MLKADGLDDAVIGVTHDMATGTRRLVYSVDKCVEVLMKRDGMDRDGAREFLEFNTLCAYIANDQPVFVDCEDYERIEDLCEDD